MIKSFAHKGLEKFFTEGSKAGFNPAHADKLRRQLARLNTDITPQQMDVAGWKLHALTGELAGHWSIWVSGNWRLTFRFEGEDAEIVDYQDYQKEKIMAHMYNPPHPGDMLKEDILPALGLSVTDAAEQLGVSRVTLSRMINGRAAISADMAIRLGQWLGDGPEIWLKQQLQYDLWQAEQKSTAKIKPVKRLNA